MIDDLYLYRASDDYKKVIEERFALPEYKKLLKLNILLQITGLPISVRVLRERGFSELTEELAEFTSCTTRIIHQKLDDDQLMSNVELEKRISCFLAQSIVENIDETRLLDICLGASCAKWTKRRVESQLMTYNDTFYNVIDFLKKLKDYDIKYYTTFKGKGCIITDLYINSRLYISLKLSIGAVTISIVSTQYDLPFWEVIIHHDSKIDLYNNRLKKSFKNVLRENLLSILFYTPNKKEEIQRIIVNDINSIFDINILPDDVCYDWSKDCYFLRQNIETEITDPFLVKDEIDKEVVKYTSIQTILATLISGKMRINSIVGMNDKTETNFMIDIIKNFRESIEKEGDEYILANRKFITSFSGKKDDLNMWRLYGDNARGVCLVFSLKSQQDSSLRKIKYVAEEDELILKINRLMISLKKKNINFCFNKMLSNLHFIKHKDYVDEDEYRYYLESDKPAGWYINNDNNVMTPYVEKNLFGNGVNSFPFQLKSIILGPAMVAQDVNFFQVKTLLNVNHILLDKVEKSKISSYR